jgi:GNAT superfamily N-acetyltransferase
VVREATRSDRPAMRDVTLAAYDEYSELIPPDGWEDYRNDITSTMMEDERPERYVAELDGRIVGCVLLYQAGTVLELPTGEQMTTREPEVRLLAVLPEVRGRGIGQALVEECKRRARAAGTEVLNLHTVFFMRSAMRLYARMGFSRNPETDFSPAPGIVIEGYRLPLTGEDSV